MRVRVKVRVRAWEEIEVVPFFFFHFLTVIHSFIHKYSLSARARFRDGSFEHVRYTKPVRLNEPSPSLTLSRVEYL